MAIVMAVMLKYFAVEAYKIPTGSMQPTLLGNDDTGIFDRILVDKLSYHFRDPERFEVATFKYPLDRSKNFIKRICGMPGEELRIQDGNLWTRKDDTQEWKILRRPKAIQREVWKRFDPADPRFDKWHAEGGSRTWDMTGRAEIHARGDGSVRLPNDTAPVRDNYRDGYPGTMSGALLRARAFPAIHEVGDLRLEGDIKALSNCRKIVVELREGEMLHSFEIPGPGASADATLRIVSTGGGPERKTELPAPWHLAAGKSISFGAQNMDDLLELEVAGHALALEIPGTSNQASSITLRVEGEGADFSGLEAYRDIYYTSDTVKQSEFKIPAGCYVMLGDNTQDSSDSREWTFAKYKWPGSGEAWVRGNWRSNNENPFVVEGGDKGAEIFFRDEWGELHRFQREGSTQGPPEGAPYVSRSQITGRAVLVFWPMVPSLGVWRLKWVH